MVYMSGSRMSRYSASITNRPTCGGGAKKAGLAPRVGFYLSSNVNLRRAPQNVPPTFCNPLGHKGWPISKTIQTQSYGYRATHGGNMG